MVQQITKKKFTALIPVGQSELMALLNVTISGTIYYVTVSGAYYAIDIRYPLQANPSAIQTTSYTEYLYQAI